MDLNVIEELHPFDVEDDDVIDGSDECPVQVLVSYNWVQLHDTYMKRNEVRFPDPVWVRSSSSVAMLLCNLFQRILTGAI